ncbi:hypothetical protein EBT25_01060 [bacterium]|jgi:T4 gene Gp59 loader of gp41 DNA helicase/T4 gene Gp59 loader of gp41 DNA helicase C-term|nr:hypothetical protein [bacterium]
MGYSLGMDAFEAYKHYLALKSHFTTKTYDFFKYNGAVKARRESFDVRKDKYFFHKLSKRKDITDYLVSLFVYGTKDSWIGDIVRNEENEKQYKQWQKVKESLTYVFMSDLEKFNDDLVSSFIVEDGQHPHALKLLLRKEIHLETFIILNDIMRFASTWNREIQDQIVWPEIKQKCKKYQPFLQYDKEKLKKVLVDKFDLKR